MKKTLAQAYIWLLLVLLYAPIVFIAIFSFTEARTLGNWTGFSFELYKNIFSGGVNGGAGLMAAIKNTLIIAFIAAAVSTLLGTVSAIGIFNLKGRKKKTIQFPSARWRFLIRSSARGPPIIEPATRPKVAQWLITVGTTTATIAKVVVQTDIHKLDQILLLISRGTGQVSASEDHTILDSLAAGSLQASEVTAIISVVGTFSIANLQHTPTARGLECSFQQVIAV